MVVVAAAAAAVVVAAEIVDWPNEPVIAERKKAKKEGTNV